MQVPLRRWRRGPQRSGKPGPLKPHVDLFKDRLRKRGYSTFAVEYYGAVAWHFNRWLAARGVTIPGITRWAVSGFLKSRGRGRGLRNEDRAALVGLLEYLRRCGALRGPLIEVSHTLTRSLDRPSSRKAPRRRRARRSRTRDPPA